VYRRDATAQKSPVHAALYLLLFPQLIAGPIIRYRDIADQLARRIVTIDGFAYGIRRFVIGLAKKVLIANVVAGPADKIFAMPFAELSAAHAWLGIVCYTLQSYFDFSGYSDMAIGLGRMFGFRFPENFRWPYIADSVQEFWRRWHITLSTWFRDYLYNPLAVNRVSHATRYRNLVAVFFLCGLWHGASWNFVIWGLWHGAFLVVERITLNRRGRRARRETQLSAISADSAVKSGFLSWPIWPHVYTMLVVMVGWVFFRADTLPGALAFLKAMAGATIAAPTMYTVWWYLTPELWLALIAGAIGSAPWVPALAARIGRAGRPRLEWTAGLLSTASLMALLAASIVSLSARTYNPFIYFRF
jgi:alginate O-acetyltransferase complex protein AlgI